MGKDLNMNILILGSGAREHAIAWKLAQSSRPLKLFVAPGNPGTAETAVNLPVDPLDFTLCLFQWNAILLCTTLAGAVKVGIAEYFNDMWIVF